jgi:uncharacterized coiled-coil protein SlyX
MNPLNQSKNRTILPGLVALTLSCFALSQQARAVCQDGCLTNQNTVLGEDALFNLTSGFFDTAIGYNALLSNTRGALNTALGAQALLENTSGTSNTASGSQALLSNSTGNNNTATGANALLDNNSGHNNTAIGSSALVLNISGSNNTASGSEALGNNTSGANNTATGRNALANNSTGNNNVALGISAGSNLTTGSNNIDIGNRAMTGESNTIRIGTTEIQTATLIAGISGATVPTGVAVIVGADGHLGTTTSSARFKEAIKPMDKASETILALKPVSFRYKRELDPNGIPQFGLVAEEVAKVNPDLVTHDAKGDICTVRYEAVNVMLLNEFLKEHKAVQELKSALRKQEAIIAQLNDDRANHQGTITNLDKALNTMLARLNEQDSKIQKVNDRLELSEPVTQLAVKKP